MKKLLLLLALLFTPLSASAQVGNMFLLPFAGVPSGTCAEPLMFAQDTTTGDFYSCNSSAWVKIGPGAAATGYQTIEEEGTPLTQRTTLNMIGGTVTCVDNVTKTDCTFTAGGGTHDILSATHTDTTAAVVSRGSVVVGKLATPKWEELVLGGVNLYLKSDGTDLIYSTLAASGVGSCGANQFETANNADAVPTCVQPNFTNLSGSATLAQLPFSAANQVLGTNAGASAIEHKTLATGTAGTDFVIVHSAGVVTFNLPTASGTNTGKLSSANWTTFNDSVDSVAGGDGITSSGGQTPSIAVDLNATADGVGLASSLSGMEFTATGELALLQGCADNELPKWTEATSIWRCAADVSGGSPSLDTITAAVAASTINSDDNAIVWNWSLTTANKVGFKISENVASVATGNPILLNLATLAASTAHPFQVTSRGTANGVRVGATDGVVVALGTGGLDWPALLNYPAGCTNQFVRTIADTPTCNTVGTSDIAGNAADNTIIRDSAGFSVIGKTATGTGDPADIVAADETVLGRTGAGNLVFAQVANGQIANLAVDSAKLAVPNKTFKCNFTLFDPGGLADTDDIPSISNCTRPGRAITITEIWAETDAGTPSINLQRDDGTPANMCTANLTPTTGGATCTVAAAEDNFAATDRLDFVMVSASTAKRINVAVQFTID